MSRRYALILAGVISSLLATSGVRSDPVSESSATVEAQPLVRALADFAKQWGLQVIYVSEIVDGRTCHCSDIAPGLSPSEQLERMLKDTDLKFEFLNSRTVGIFSAKPANAKTKSAAISNGDLTVTNPNNSKRFASRLARRSILTLSMAGVAAHAQEGPVLEEIMVTAQRKEERLQDVPISVTAVSADALSAQHIESSTDLSRFVPSLTVGGTFRDNQSFALRGLGNAGGGPAVVSYFADVPDLGPPVGGGFVSSGGSGPGLFYDLENVQVLKGPQGTLFGQSTIGGAILFTPKKPSADFGGYLQAQGGNYDDRELQGAINFPLVGDELLVRIAAASARRDGFTKDLSGGPDLDDRQYDAVRVSVLYQPTDRFENSLVFNGVDIDNQGGSVIAAVLPANSFLPFLYPTYPAVFAAQQEAGPRQIVGSFGNGENVTAAFRQKHLFVGDTATWQVSDGLTLKNILAWQRVQFLNRFDLDGTSLPILDMVTQGWTSQVQQVTEELQLQGVSLQDRLNWTTGLFLSDVRPFGGQNTSLVIYGQSGGPNNPRATTLDERAKSYGLYAQGTYDLGGLSQALDRFKVTAGLRYTWDKRTASDTEISGAGTCTAFVSVLPDCRAEGAADFKAPSWNLTLDYQASTDTLVYLATRRGYISGGLNVLSPFPGTQSFDPQTLTDLELGVKSDWTLGGVPIRTNLSAYVGSLDDKQVVFNAVDPGGNFISYIQNAASETRRGVELEATIAPVTGLDISASYSYQEAEIDEYKVPGVVVKDPIFYGLPKNKVAASISYLLPFPSSEFGDIRLVAGGTYQSLTYGSFAPTRVEGLRIPSYSVLNLSAEWNNVFASPIDLSLFMTNVTDETYQIGATGSSSQGFFVHIYGEPRMYGARLRYRFGAEN